MSCFNGRMNEYRRISLDRFDGKNLTSTAYFLSHCHEDHTQGLDKDIFLERLQCRTDVYLYCSQVTKILLLENNKYSHLEKYIKTIEVEVPTTVPIPDTESNKVENVTVTLLHAAHCPGSVMFLFEGTEGAVLYTGDFRWESKHVAKVAALHSGEGVKKIESLYVDTTFCHPSSFYIPYRQDCADAVYNLVTEWIAKGSNHMVHFTPRSTYGHEHLLKDIAERTRYRVHVAPWKANIYKQIPELCDVFTKYADETPIHACYGEKYNKDRSRLPCSKELMNKEKLNVMVILPSTMYFTKKVHLDLTDVVEKKGGIYRVCYSFHSSMIEVRDLVTYLQPRRVRPNVKPIEDQNLSEVQKRLNEFLQLKHKRQISEEIAIKPLGTLRKSRFTRKRQISVASSDSEGLVFNSPDLKRQKISIKSPSTTPNKGADNQEDDSDLDDSHSSYAGSHVDSESELSGICELDQEDNQLSTPGQSFLDAIDSQNSQESPEGGKSNSLSYRVCLDEDEEQTVGNAASEIIPEEVQEGDADEQLAEINQDIEKDSDRSDYKDNPERSDGKAKSYENSVKRNDFESVKNGKNRNVNCFEREDEAVCNEKSKKLHKGKKNESKAIIDRKNNGTSKDSSTDINFVSDDLEIYSPKILNKKFCRSGGKEKGERIVNVGEFEKNGIEKTAKFEKHGSFDLFDSSGSESSFVVTNDCEVVGKMCGKVPEDPVNTIKKNDISKFVRDQNRVNIEKPHNRILKERQHLRDETKFTSEHKATGIKDENDTDIDESEKLDCQSTKSSQGFIVSDSQSTKSSQGFIVSDLNDWESHSSKHQKEKIVMIDDETDDSDENMNNIELRMKKKSKSKTSDSTFKTVPHKKAKTVNNFIPVDDSDDRHCDEMQTKRSVCIETGDFDDGSDSDETLPPSQNSIFLFNVDESNNSTVKVMQEKREVDDDDDIFFVSDDIDRSFTSSPKKKHLHKKQNVHLSYKNRNLHESDFDLIDMTDKDSIGDISDDDEASSVIDLTLSDSDLDS